MGRVLQTRSLAHRLTHPMCAATVGTAVSVRLRVRPVLWLPHDPQEDLQPARGLRGLQRAIVWAATPASLSTCADHCNGLGPQVGTLGGLAVQPALASR